MPKFHLGRLPNFPGSVISMLRPPSQETLRNGGEPGCKHQHGYLPPSHELARLTPALNHCLFSGSTHVSLAHLCAPCCVCLCACVPEIKLQSFLNHTTPYLSRQGVPLNLQLTNRARLEPQDPSVSASSALGSQACQHALLFVQVLGSKPGPCCSESKFFTC